MQAQFLQTSKTDTYLKIIYLTLFCDFKSELDHILRAGWLID